MHSGQRARHTADQLDEPLVQIRTTKRQRDETAQAGLPVTESWRKKLALCEFFVLVSEFHRECWVFPSETIAEVVEANRAVYGKRPDNVRGEHVEMNLDIARDGRPLTEIFAA